MDSGSEIISLWVGPHSQKAAHHFYALQAEQFFQESEDPTNHHALWTFKDKQMNERYPRMIIFDTESDHLTKLRKVNLKKILKKMSKPTKDTSFFPFQFIPQEEEKEQKEEFDPNQWMFDNWGATEDNYILIDKDYSEMSGSYDLWDHLFNFKCDLYQDKMRKQLEKTDFLRIFTLCTDGNRLGFTNRIVEYLHDECPKRSIVMTNLTDNEVENYNNECFLPLIGHLSSQVNLLLDFNIQPQSYPFFEGDDFYHNLSPILNSLYTPFMLKDSNCDNFFQKIQHDNKTIFNMAYTLPVIDEDMKLDLGTNILEYLPKFDAKSGKKVDTWLEKQNRINFGNRTYLNLIEEQKSKKISSQKLEKIKPVSNKILSESFVMKGNFNQITDLFKQKTNNFQIKYLKGILTVNPKSNLRYSEFYRPHYSEEVENYPFHSVLFQHQDFGPSLRNYMKMNVGSKIGSEMISQWKESSLSIADHYSQSQREDSD